MTEISHHSTASDSDSPDPDSPASDVRLLLRAHAEGRWLSHEVVPVLRELERDGPLSEEQLGATLAYLEVLWLEACGRAAETEATCTALESPQAGRIGEDGLHGRARRYHAAVRRLRGAVASRVTELGAMGHGRRSQA